MTTSVTSTLTLSTPDDLEIHHLDWSNLRMLNAYRIFLLITLGVTFHLPQGAAGVGSVDPRLFLITLLVYMSLAAVFSVMIWLRTLNLATQFYVQSYVDILTLSILMYCSGGVQSGLGIPLVISIAIVAHCCTPKHALLFAAISSMTILTQETLLAQQLGVAFVSYSQAALSGVTLFATGYLISVILPVRQNQVMLNQHAEIQTLANTNDLITSDLRLAANLQSSLLPKPGQFENVRLSGFCSPALFVAGDIFDYFLVKPKTLVFYMADVVGHGAASAMISYAVHNHLNPRSDGICVRNFEQADSAEEFIQLTLRDLNVSFVDTGEDYHYFTLHFGVLNLDSGELSFCQAGHPLPILHRASTDEMQELGVGGMPVGMFADVKYEVSHCQLTPGDRFYVFSDGATESFSPQQEEFGVERLMSTLKNTANSADNPEESVSQTRSVLIDALKQWQQKEEFGDDVSLLTVHYD